MNSNEDAWIFGPEAPRRAEVVLAAVFTDGLPPESPNHSLRRGVCPSAETHGEVARRFAAQVFEGWQGQMNGVKRGRSRRQSGRDRAGHSPALTWLSLVGLLLSRARLRFTRRFP